MKAEYVTMTFEKGVPKTLNGKAMKVSEIITELNELGGKHGIGIIDIVENRVVGMKSRGVYETPGGTILMEAHQQLEELVLDRATHGSQERYWATSLLRSFTKENGSHHFVRQSRHSSTSTQEYVTGEVKFKLYKGNIIKAGTTSPYSLYNESLASFTTGDLYDHHDADGFITSVRSAAESSCNEACRSRKSETDQRLIFIKNKINQKHLRKFLILPEMFFAAFYFM